MMNGSDVPFVEGSEVVEDMTRPLHVLELVFGSVFVLDVDSNMVAVECLTTCDVSGRVSVDLCDIHCGRNEHGRLGEGDVWYFLRTRFRAPVRVAWLLGKTFAYVLILPFCRVDVVPQKIDALASRQQYLV